MPRPKSDPGPKGRILIVDDDPIVADSLAEFLRAEGHDASACLTAEEALLALDKAAAASGGTGVPPAGSAATPTPRPFDVVISDVNMPGINGLELLAQVREKHPQTVVLMLTGYGTIESAVEAIRAGAMDYLSKPVVDSELRLSLEKALRQQALLAENSQLRANLEGRFGLGALIGGDYRMVKAFELVNSVASSKITVLMTGESGTGKSVVARAIHQGSPRAKRPFVEIHCGSVPETLLESELFGHVKGAFTGAHTDKQGKFLAADTGTIFIDEINSASPGMQLKLLRVLQERRFEPVGSTHTTEVDVRVVLATNQPLEELVAKGLFRQDLYYRINVVKIELPPLRDRPADVPALVEHFLRKHCNTHQRTVLGVAPDAMDLLKRYHYPGNVRELENIMERAVVLSTRPTVMREDLPPYVTDDPTSVAGRSLAPHLRAGLQADDAVDAPDTPWVPTALEDALAQPEKRIILKALRANEWNRQATADQLNINRTTLYKKMKQHGLDRMAG
ncbi:MAG: sigma-54-dependent transcriptional regulator [Phycisphaerales bacterium]